MTDVLDQFKYQHVNDQQFKEYALRKFDKIIQLLEDIKELNKPPEVRLAELMMYTPQDIKEYKPGGIFKVKKEDE